MHATRRFLVALGAAGAMAGAAAQTRDPVPVQQNQSIVTAEAPRTPSVAANQSTEDIDFLLEAVRTDLAEVQMGELARQRAGDPAVREFGRKLAADHLHALQELEQILQPLDVTIPSEPTAEAQSHYAALSGLSGAEFDAAFLHMMIASHEEAIEEYGAQTHANPNKQLADFATRALPMLRDHLATAESLR